jgi:hypothetical protein
LGAVYNRENVTDGSNVDESAEALVGVTFRRFKPGRSSVTSMAAEEKAASNDDRQDVNYFSAQWFVNYNFGKGLALGTAPIITCDWKRESGDECTIPCGLQISKVLNLGQRPANLLFGYYKNSSHPDKGAENEVRFQINFMFPQKKK